MILINLFIISGALFVLIVRPLSFFSILLILETIVLQFILLFAVGSLLTHTAFGFVYALSLIGLAGAESCTAIALFLTFYYTNQGKTDLYSEPTGVRYF